MSDVQEIEYLILGLCPKCGNPSLAYLVYPESVYFICNHYLCDWDKEYFLEVLKVNGFSHENYQT
jgi:hypothetical protein